MCRSHTCEPSPALECISPFSLPSVRAWALDTPPFLTPEGFSLQGRNLLLLNVMRVVKAVLWCRGVCSWPLDIVLSRSSVPGQGLFVCSALLRVFGLGS